MYLSSGRLCWEKFTLLDDARSSCARNPHLHSLGLRKIQLALLFIQLVDGNCMMCHSHYQIQKTWRCTAWLHTRLLKDELWTRAFHLLSRQYFLQEAPNQNQNHQRPFRLVDHPSSVQCQDTPPATLHQLTRNTTLVTQKTTGLRCWRYFLRTTCNSYYTLSGVELAYNIFSTVGEVLVCCHCGALANRTVLASRYGACSFFWWGDVTFLIVLIDLGSHKKSRTPTGEWQSYVGWKSFRKISFDTSFSKFPKFQPSLSNLQRPLERCEKLVPAWSSQMVTSHPIPNPRL